MLRQTVSRAAPRASLASPAAAAACACVPRAGLLAGFRAAQSSSTSAAVVHARACPVFLQASGSIRRYSIDTVRRTDFADKGDIAFDEVKELTETPGKAFIIDVRELEEIQQGNIPSSLPLPLSRLPEALRMDAAEFERTFTFAKPRPDQPIVVYCRSGKRSTTAKGLMEDLPPTEKFTNIRNYTGSWLDWSAKDQPKNEEDDE